MSCVISSAGEVGRTPLEMNEVKPVLGGHLLVELEAANLTGSMKRRLPRSFGLPLPTVTWHRGSGRRGTTGLSLVFACAALDDKLLAVHSDAFSVEERQPLASFGAQLTAVSSDKTASPGTSSGKLWPRRPRSPSTPGPLVRRADQRRQCSRV